MIDINGGELIVLFVVAVIVIGPTRLPGYAEQLGRWIRQLRVFLRDAKKRVDEELGDDTDLDWAALDPRKYDPRRIVREALLDDEPVVAAPGYRAPRHPSPRPARASAVAAAGAGTSAAAAVGDAGSATIGSTDVADAPVSLAEPVIEASGSAPDAAAGGGHTAADLDTITTAPTEQQASDGTTAPSTVDGILVDDEAT